MLANLVIKKSTGKISFSLQYALILFASLSLSSCGGGGGDGDGSATVGTTSYSISVITSGLTSSGLSVGVSSDAGIETMSISSNGTRSFALSLPAGSLFTVGIGTQPTGQSCSLGGGFFSTNMSSDASVTVTCVSTRTVAGNISGLTSNVTLKLNGSNSTTFSTNGVFTFSNQLADGDYYAVSVGTQPTGQTCLVTNSSGQISGANITNIAVTCSTSVAGYKVGGKISGLYGAIKLGLNGIEEFSAVINGTFSFASSLAANTPYTVTVLNSPAGYTCFVNNGSGTIVSSDFPFVEINCESNSTGIKPLVDPDGAYLDSGETITLTLNGTTDLTLDSWDWNPIPFSAALNVDDPYVVTIKTNPVGKNCLLYNSVGMIKAGSTPVIAIRCVSDTSLSYTIGGSISNLTGTGLVLGLDGRDSLVIDAVSGTYTFPNPQLSSASHYVSIVSQPTGQICNIPNNNASVFASDVTNIDVICSAGPHSIGGSTVGIAATGLSLSLNGAEAISVPSDGSFVFNTLLSDGMSYEISIGSHPTDQVCTINNAFGWNISASSDNTLIECQSVDYSISTHIQGYNSSTPLLLQLNGMEIIEASVNTTSIWSPYTFNPVPFNTHLKAGDSYYVSIAGQPEGQVCSLTNGAGVVGTSNITNIGVICVTDVVSSGSYSVNVSTSGLKGSGLVLQLNGLSELVVITDGFDVFSTTLTDTSAYTVSVLTQPTSPIQNCKVINSSGVIAAENITSVSVQCENGVQSRYPANGDRWLDYVKNDGVNKFSATDLACVSGVDTGGYDACLNGGEYRVVSMPSLISCATVTATDNLNAFNWVCDETNGVHLISTGLKSNVSLTDLIDFFDSGFKPNFVTVFDSGAYVDSTDASVWWNNPVITNNTGAVINTGEIVLVTASVYEGLEMNHKAAVLIQPGVVLGGPIFSSSKQYLWFEGDVTVTASNPVSTTGLSWFGANFSVVQNVQSINNIGSGLQFSGFNSKLKNIVTNNNASTGIRVTGNGNLLENITTNNNAGGFGGMYIITKNSVLNNITASGNVAYGIQLNTSGNVNMTNVTANDNGLGAQSLSGIRIFSLSATLPGPHVFTNITTNNNGLYGIEAEDFSDSSFTNVTVKNNNRGGINIRLAKNISLSNVIVSGNSGIGFDAYKLLNSRINNLFVANNSLDGIYLDYSDDLFLNNITSNNNAGYGYKFRYSDRVISSNIIVTNNTGSGIKNLWSTEHVMIGVTSVNNAGSGLELSSASNSNLSSILSLNNAVDGIYNLGSNSFNVENFVMANNTGYGIRLISTDNGFYTGLLEMGSNGMGDCLVDVTATLPGLWQDGPNTNNLNNDCILNGASDGTLIPFVDASTSIVGKVVNDDTSTLDDNLGHSLYENITGWYMFDNSLRTWGFDGALPFADVSNQGACNTIGLNCRIWDWSASKFDTGNSGAPAINNVVPLPIETDVLTMDWTTSGATSQTYCDTTYPGSVWDGVGICTSTYLRNTQEITGDSIGNDNALCEKGETCLYMPNIGAYQGHGALVAAGTVGTGVDTITLQRYTTLAR